jgi:hypothetical protein
MKNNMSVNTRDVISSFINNYMKLKKDTFEQERIRVNDIHLCIIYEKYFQLYRPHHDIYALNVSFNGEVSCYFGKRFKDQGAFDYNNPCPIDLTDYVKANKDYAEKDSKVFVNTDVHKKILMNYSKGKTSILGPSKKGFANIITKNRGETFSIIVRLSYRSDEEKYRHGHYIPIVFNNCDISNMTCDIFMFMVNSYNNIIYDDIIISTLYTYFRDKIGCLVNKRKFALLPVNINYNFCGISNGICVVSAIMIQYMINIIKLDLCEVCTTLSINTNYKKYFLYGFMQFHLHHVFCTGKLDKSSTLKIIKYRPALDELDDKLLIDLYNIAILQSNDLMEIFGKKNVRQTTDKYSLKSGTFDLKNAFKQ